LQRVAVSPTDRLPGGDGDGVARELYGGHVDLCRDGGAGRAERGGLRRAVEPRAEALQVERDRELEAIEDVLWRGDPLRRALDRGAGSVAGMKRKRVRGPRNQDVDRGAPSRAYGGAHERAHVRAEPDVRIQACVEPAGKIGRASCREKVWSARVGARLRKTKVED